MLILLLCSANCVLRKNLEQEDNSRLILKFLDSLFADRLSKPRVVKYDYHMVVISNMMKKSFLRMDKDDITAFLSKLEQSDYTASTKVDYKVVPRRFLKFLEKGDLVKGMKTTLKQDRKKLPEEILTKDEVKK